MEPRTKELHAHGRSEPVDTVTIRLPSSRLRLLSHKARQGTMGKPIEVEKAGLQYWNKEMLESNSFLDRGQRPQCAVKTVGIWPVGAPGIRHAALLFCAILFLLTGKCLAQPTNIQEFPILSGFYSVPEGIAYGADGAYWFMEYWASRIGRIDPANSNSITEIIMTNGPGFFPFGLTRGPAGDNHLWFTESVGNKIGRLNTTASNYVEFPLAIANSQPWTITTGPDNNLWFIEFFRNGIAGFSPTDISNANGTLKLIHEIPCIRTNSQMYGLTAGPDGNLWFTEGTWGIIGRITFDGTYSVTEFHLPSTNCQPVSIVSGLDGALWFSEFNSNKIGRITTNGQVTEFPVPINPSFPNPQPYGMLAAGDGNLWFTEYSGSAVGRITTNGIITIFPTPTISSFPAFMASGPAGAADTNIWFGENVDGTPGLTYENIGRLVVSEALSLDAPTTTSFTSGTTISNLLATFQNSNATNTVKVNWGDGTGDALVIANPAVNASVTTNTILTTNSVKVTNSLTISNTMPIVAKGIIGTNGSYNILASHTYSVLSNYLITLTVTDASNDMATASIALPPIPFFNGQASLGSQIDYLQFPDSTIFGYYSLQDYPYVYHFDLGFEYFIDGHDGQGGVYVYDFTSGHFFYTSPTLFPYLYDFTLNAWLYYYPDTTRAGHYTTNPRYFYNFGASQIITQ